MSSAHNTNFVRIALLASLALALTACESAGGPGTSRSRRSTPSGRRAHPFYEAPDVDLIPVEELKRRRGEGGTASGAVDAIQPPPEVVEHDGWEDVGAEAPAGGATAGDDELFGLEEDWPEVGTSIAIEGELPNAYEGVPSVGGSTEIAARPVDDPLAGTYAPPVSAHVELAPEGDDSLSPLGTGAARLTPVARLSHPDIRENRGLAEIGGIYYTINDSGGAAELFASTVPWFEGAQRIEVPGAKNVDWEDLAELDGDLLVCDVGDNLRRRDDATIYRVRPENGGARLVATYPIAYPDGPQNVEAVVVLGGVVHAISKETGTVYAFPSLLDVRELAATDNNVGEVVGRLDVGAGEFVTAADVHADGIVGVMTYSELLLYPADRLDGEPMGGFALHARQNEALAFVGNSAVFTNEQRDVYIVDDVLFVGEYWWLPERTSARLKQVPLTKEALQASMPPMELLAEMPMRNARRGEFLRFGVSADQFFFDGRFFLDDGFTPSDAAGRLGTSLLIVFGEEQRLRVSASDYQLALVGTDSGRLRPRRIDLNGGSAPSGLTGVSYGGQANTKQFRFTLSIDVDSVFPDGVPEVFLLNVCGNGFRRAGGTEPVLSGFDYYTMLRPFMWGAIHRE